MADIVIYSSAAGGGHIQKNTQKLYDVIKAHGGNPKVTYIDIDATDKQMVWDKSGQKGVYPLLFVNGEFIGNAEECENFNEAELLKGKCGL
mmetsp:Transcript_39285/g.99010  ORF Transcript_39285/g.99010 Transcript_39285/m.99010 type:complete len:91 (+) Transcript_39285:107-379(+)|eukprot:CAMPEP_0177649220 /NCGR_PEP_ID=MMETSP0447-20121125/11259_1 /TAXON_ID=0 /ORGANISM="Stygamoeba regulata, Strain BSH-02190019" /LENGTH=90 /DNA_ID=CAMNT_0019151941 /DNA_START=92 /DNA_END=364 /DNA_ORIENTATION=-